MNKRIFSLVCIILYALLAASIHCSQQKASAVGNKRVRDTKEINKRNEKNDVESKCETQLKNNNHKDGEYKKKLRYEDLFPGEASLGVSCRSLYLKRWYRA
ncbi:fam-c protein [Plasmodium vinckei brucechwatti]|uniref:Fam-c protein n=1 Tax=Plasmodium vinckei brucechwatti TaxID=119398 RepID=A0A6V7S0F1_PLAVN|nr:fam-c protein [Plasmodium vinckei brucechwatti]